jgi:hypothetical protein
VLLAGVEAWAVPLNTFLLIILACITTYAAKSSAITKNRDMPDIKGKLGMTKRSYDIKENLTVTDTGRRRRISDPPHVRERNARVGLSSEVDPEAEEDVPRVRRPQK